MEYRKSIAWAFPTSTNAEHLGAAESGTYYVEQQVKREDGSWSPGYIAPGTDGEAFARHDDPELRQLLAETEGELCPYSFKYHPEYYA